MTGWILLLLASLLASGGASATPSATPNTRALEDGAASPAARVADVGWLEGTWVGEGLGGQVEEIWSAPAAGALMGSFRAMREGAPLFYESFIIVEEEGSLALRLKHFNADYTGWEEKDELKIFPLVALEDEAVYFDGLTYRRSGNVLEAFVVVDHDGERSEYAFHYTLREPESMSSSPISLVQEELFAADRAFAAEVAKGGAAAWASWFARTGTQFPSAGRLEGREAIEAHMQGLFDGGNQLHWDPVTAVAAASGDLGYTLGRWKFSNPEGVVAATGNYVSIWTRTADEGWRVAVDIGNSDPDE